MMLIKIYYNQLVQIQQHIAITNAPTYYDLLLLFKHFTIKQKRPHYEHSLLIRKCSL